MTARRNLLRKPAEVTRKALPLSAPVAAMDESRRRAGPSRTPRLDLAIGLAFWAGFAALFLSYLGVIG